MPTGPKLLSGFLQLDIPLQELLDPSSVQRLMYSLYIVESLSVRPKQDGEESWASKFVRSGGLRHLFDIFMSGMSDMKVLGSNLYLLFCLRCSSKGW